MILWLLPTPKFTSTYNKGVFSGDFSVLSLCSALAGSRILSMSFLRLVVFKSPPSNSKFGQNKSRKNLPSTILSKLAYNASLSLTVEDKYSIW